MKKGAKTSEFYITLICVFVSFIGAVFYGLDAGQIGSINAVALVYVSSRAYVKGNKDE
tara:strand:- start:6643 stop:6816 length:174 start_codon:yes stop_codon:yes gene_type:complete